MTLQEAERITARYRRWFFESGDTDITLVRRCHDVLSGGAYTMATVTLFALGGLFRRSLPAAIIAAVACYALAMFFLVCAPQLARVRAFFETHGPQNLSDLPYQLRNDRNG